MLAFSLFSCFNSRKFSYKMPELKIYPQFFPNSLKAFPFSLNVYHCFIIFLFFFYFFFCYSFPVFLLFPISFFLKTIFFSYLNSSFIFVKHFDFYSFDYISNNTIDLSSLVPRIYLQPLNRNFYTKFFSILKSVGSCYFSRMRCDLNYFIDSKSFNVDSGLKYSIIYLLHVFLEVKNVKKISVFLLLLKLINFCFVLHYHVKNCIRVLYVHKIIFLRIFYL